LYVISYNGFMSIPRLLAALFLAAPVAAQQSQDTAYMRMIREYTTDPAFLPSNLTSFPIAKGVPSPKDHFGTIIGAPGVMHHSDEVYGYFRALAKATSRVKVETLGKTDEGKDIVLVIVADEQTMKQLDRYKAAMAKLADPRTIPADQVEKVIADAKPIYYFNGGLHSTEMGSPETLMELGYRLAVDESPAIKKIRDNVITIFNPVSEPDGRDRQVDWYNVYSKGKLGPGKRYPTSPPYWGNYVLHDNNRDGIQLSQKTTHAITKAYFDWHPLVMHDLHESIPLLYISTGTGPYNETNDPTIVGEWHLLANNDITQLNAKGMPGVWTWGFFDGWWPGYGVWVATNHNAISRFYETQGAAGGDTYVHEIGEQTREWYRALPPTKKIRWSSRDNVNYTLAGVLSSLGFVAENRSTFLRNFWQKGTNSINRGLTKAPHAFLIPGFDRQRDPKRTAYLVNQLRRHAIEVRRVSAGDSTGDFYVLLNQPYRDLAVNLLTKQAFPASAQHAPYDDIAWTLGYLYGAEVRAVDDSTVLAKQNLTLLADTVAATANVRGTGSTFVLPYKAQGELLPALFWLKQRGARVKALAMEELYTSGRDTLPRGSVIFEGLDQSTASELASKYALPLLAMSAAPSVATHEIDAPRIALYHTWDDTQDEGWVRYTLELSGIPYTSIDNERVRRGSLRDKFDVIIIPEIFANGKNIIYGPDAEFGPLPYKKTAAAPSFGAPDSSSDITQGMGYEGLAELRRFIEGGGTMLTLGSGTGFVSETNLVRQIAPQATPGLFHPGSIVRARMRQPKSPILYGYPDVFMIFRGNGPLYSVPAADSNLTVLQYGTRRPPPPKDEGPMLGMPETWKRSSAHQTEVVGTGAARDTAASKQASSTSDLPYLVSGLVKNDQVIIGQGAIFDIPVKEGRLIAFTFNPLHRYLTHQQFPLVWNALLNWNDRPKQ
jgi:hypothetical protein